MRSSVRRVWPILLVWSVVLTTEGKRMTTWQVLKLVASGKMLPEFALDRLWRGMGWTRTAARGRILDRLYAGDITPEQAEMEWSHSVMATAYAKR